MSERILRALMQLFAIVARVEPVSGDDENVGRRIVRLFLKQQLSQKLVNQYIKVFDDFIEQHQPYSTKENQRKKTSVASVKVLRICTQINEELTQKQKFIVLLRLLEFIYTHTTVTDQEVEFVSTVASTFNIPENEFLLMQELVRGTGDEIIDDENYLVISGNESVEHKKALHFYSEGLNETIIVLRISSLNLFFVRYRGESVLMMNGQHLIPSYIHVLNPGASIRSPRRHNSLYYSDILGCFMNGSDYAGLQLSVQNLTYHFPFGNQGLHPLSFTEESGKLVGIMGGSGSGKSTLLNILNGNLKPSGGHVKINGYDMHSERNELDGVVGYIAQDDLLIEELTVYQNLFYNAKLCFGNRSNEEIKSLVGETLADLGLSDVSHLKVGNPLEKTISGGQRKRLNIALELIREPMVLFVDEPTSGLSSRDSENIMDLLKELSLKGKLIFVVIHQPSSDIFKMFDRLVILDQGGYPVFNGNPVESVTYFKHLMNHVDSDQCECPECGNVNPEQIFNIIEAKVVDEFGHLTSKRKTSPEEWYQNYKNTFGQHDHKEESEKVLPEIKFKIPTRLKQIKVFLKRDVLAKISNLQYMLINFLEAPLLAALLTFFIRYFVYDPATGGDYIFRANENIPQYIFISVIVALFFGLTVSSEEIIRDRRIIARESFLNLSRRSYLLSKIGVMFTISAVQTLSFVMVGNLILGIQDMHLFYWLMLFSTSCFANMLGLNISATFNSAKVIYIIIPVLIIPQLLFSGVIVKFDKLHPTISSQAGVPLIGNIMASRWAYEGLAVAQYTQNAYDSQFFEYEKRKKFSNWKKDYWVKELKNRVNTSKRLLGVPEKVSELAHNLDVLRNEISMENQFLNGIGFAHLALLNPEDVTPAILDEANNYLDVLVTHYRKVYNKASDEKERKLVEMTSTDELRAQFQELQNNYSNESLESFVTNKNDLTYILEHNNRLIQKKDLIYRDTFHAGLFDAHFYAPSKLIGGFQVPTFWANLLVIWGMSLLLVLVLFVDGFKRIMGMLNSIVLKLLPTPPKRTTSPSVM